MMKGKPAAGPDLPFAADMDIDDDGFGIDIHDVPQEKIDADFFNGAPAPGPVGPPPPLSRTRARAEFDDDFDDEDVA